jgi:predicted AAA+ superfamily ATPase
MKEFNITGTCIPHLHYMVNTNSKLEKISSLIERGRYFTINRPRQFGKTTTLYLLNKSLGEKYEVIKISFEGVGDFSFENEESLATVFPSLLQESLGNTKNEHLIPYIQNYPPLKSLRDLSKFITDFVKD